MLKTLEDIILMVRERKTKPQSESYTNKLLANKDLSVEKVKEGKEFPVEQLQEVMIISKKIKKTKINKNKNKQK